MFADKFFPPIFRSDFTPSKLSRDGRRTSGSGVQNEAWGRCDFGNQNEPDGDSSIHPRKATGKTVLTC
jgi:hypothetical protein